MWEYAGRQDRMPTGRKSIVEGIKKCCWQKERARTPAFLKPTKNIDIYSQVVAVCSVEVRELLQVGGYLVVPQKSTCPITTENCFSFSFLPFLM